MTLCPCNLADISALDRELQGHFQTKFLVDDRLTRQMVSFQANKTRPQYRWYRYKEAFSASFVEHLLREYQIRSGRMLDPFAGSGTALFVASNGGMDADGIELLPTAQEIIKARDSVERKISEEDLASIKRTIDHAPWKRVRGKRRLRSIKITEGAYPRATQEDIERFLFFIEGERENLRQILFFALLSILESVSFTRKDGQYLRWDTRSGRHNGRRPFDKGRILGFDEAITGKLEEIVSDVRRGRTDARRNPDGKRGRVHLYSGSCLDILPRIPSDTYDAIVTSPPYCNRYDYTRTYALELALMGVDDDGVKALRQTMLSSTVENREKALLQMNGDWKSAIDAVHDHALLQAILCYLHDLNRGHDLNNTGIPRMVKCYFYEMSCIIGECSRVLKPGAPLVMANDNVRYAGADISVDMILSSIAERLGFTVENILVLPKGKGNSSQQMRKHGRTGLRKCIYVWRRND